MVHNTGGYMTGVYESSRLVFQLRSDDIFWCTADIGWVTGHSYTVLAPLLHGCTTVVFEGMPSWPNKDRIWEIIDRHKITVLYTAPTAINDFVAGGSEWPAKHNLNSLRLLGTVGEPITETAWNWYFEHVGKGHCAIVDTWWQTETGAILISAVPGATEGKPSWAGPPLPGVFANIREAIYEETDDGTKVRPGEPIPTGSKGLLTIDHPWPARAFTMWGGDEEQKRFLKTYFPGGASGPYVPMDLAFCDEDNNYRILGRADDVIIVAGHNIGTGELENVIREHPAVSKVIVVARPDERTGQAIVAFIVTDSTHQPGDDAARKSLADDIRHFVKKNRASHWAPAHIEFVPTLMTTLSGKHMRRFYRQIAQGDVEGLGKANKATLAMPEEFDRLVESFGLAPAISK
jgi:acetyl-CoA synthetase